MMATRFVNYPDIILNFLEDNGLNPKFRKNQYVSDIIVDDILSEINETKETYELKDTLQASKMFLTANVRYDEDEYYTRKYDRDSSIIMPRTIVLIDRDGNLILRHKTKTNYAIDSIKRTDFDRYYTIINGDYIAVLDYLEQLSKSRCPDKKFNYEAFSELALRQYNEYGLETDLKCAHQNAKLLSDEHFGKASDVLKFIDGKKNLAFLSNISETGTHRRENLVTYDFYTYKANGTYLTLNSSQIIKKYRKKDLSKLTEPISKLENPKDSFLQYEKYQYPTDIVQKGIDNLPIFDEFSYNSYLKMTNSEKQKNIEEIMRKSMYNDSFKATYDDERER